MKAGVLAVAAALAAGVSASKPNARHAHAAFHERDLYLTAGTAPAPQETDCGCVTKYSTVTGEGTRM